MQVRDLADHDGVVAAARQLEVLGYDELFSYDHVGAVDPFVPLMIAAGATTRLRVGPLVINNELHHPALLARTAATVDRLTGGRLVLGLGTGFAQSEHDAIGMLLRAPGPRVTRFEESVRTLRSLLDTGAVQLNGEHHHLDVDDLGVRPLQDRVPFLIGGHGRRVIGVAARYADIFQFTGLEDLPGGQLSAGGFDLDAIRQRARWLTDAAGDRNDDIERSALVQAVDIADDADVRLDAVAERFDVARQVIDETPFALIGSVQQVVDKIERLRADVGISHYVIRDAEAFAPVAAILSGR